MTQLDTLSKINKLLEYWPADKQSCFVDHAVSNTRTTKDGKAVVRLIINKSMFEGKIKLIEFKQTMDDLVDYVFAAFKEVTGEKLRAKKVSEEAVFNPRNLDNDFDCRYFVDLELEDEA